METIRVNMTPCEDVETIHASQNDNEAREWGFELHNNGEKIDSSSISDQLVFKAYKGGTEELLPSSLMNGSVDLGSLAWTYMPNNYFRSTSVISDAKIPSNENTVANIFCSILKPNTANNVYANNEGIAIDGTGRIRIYYDDMPTNVASFTQAMQGVLLWYEKNDSTPTTTPFLGDIKYPQGLLTNQQFTYRESPTEEDGLANIVGIKGQTLKWNQLIQNGNFESTDSWALRGTNTSFTVSNNVASITAGSQWGGINHNLPFTVNQSHKFLVIADIKGTTDNYISIGSGANAYVTQNNVWQRLYIELPSASSQWLALTIGDRRSSDWTEFNVRNAMLIDLTLVFGSGNEPTFEEFASLFPLDYYPFSQGSLIPFNGNGIRATGKNLVSLTLSPARQQRVAGVTIQSQTNEEFTVTSTGSGTYSNLGLYYNLKKGTYTLKFQAEASDSFAPIITVYDGNTSQVISNSVPRNTARTFTLTQDRMVEFRCFATTTSAVRTVRFYDFQLEFGSTATSYEPYTSSTLSLPISTYFPSGMNGHGDTYDELTSAVATKRFEKNSLGDLTWTRRTTNIFSTNLPSEFDASKDISCFISNRLPTVFVSGYTLAEDGYISIYKTTTVTSSTTIYLNMASQSIDTVADLQTWLSNNPTELVYPLATPTETSFTTASLVTENGEIPLSNEDGVLIGKCTEQLSSESGFFNAKIKLADEDGECYSNKIQLHIERSPQ